MDHFDEVVGVHFPTHFGAFKEAVGEGAFLLVELDDFFFDRVFCDNSVDGDGAFLAHAVGAIGGLIFHGGVPPGIHVDDIIGGGEVESGSACFEADEEDVAFSSLEGIDALFAVLHGGAAVEVLVMNALFVEIGADEGQVIDKLAEDEGFVVVVEEFGDDGGEDFELAAGDGDFGFDQLSVAAGTAQAHDFGENLQVFLSGRGVAFFQFGDDFSAQGFVKNHFFFA